jgi:hypothetical protein
VIQTMLKVPETPAKLLDVGPKGPRWVWELIGRFANLVQITTWAPVVFVIAYFTSHTPDEPAPTPTPRRPCRARPEPLSGPMVERPVAGKSEEWRAACVTR